MAGWYLAALLLGWNENGGVVLGRPTSWLEREWRGGTWPPYFLAGTRMAGWYLAALLLGCLEVGVRSAGVVGDVDHVHDLRHRFADGDLDALRKGDRGQATALAASAEAEVGGVLLHGHKLGGATVGGDGGVDLLLEYLHHPLGHVSAQVGRGPASDRRG